MPLSSCLVLTVRRDLTTWLSVSETEGERDIVYAVVVMYVHDGSHLGRMYDFHILDMIELGIEKFKPFADFKVSVGAGFYYFIPPSYPPSLSLPLSSSLSLHLPAFLSLPPSLPSPLSLPPVQELCSWLKAMSNILWRSF